MHAVLCFAISASQLFSLQIGVSGILLLASHSISNHAARILGALGESSFHTQVLWGQFKFGKTLLWEASRGHSCS